VANEGRIKQEYAQSNGILANPGEDTAAMREQKFSGTISDDEWVAFDILLGEPQRGPGLHVKDIAQKSVSLSVNGVFEAGEVLLGEGLIYTTVDNETWAVLEY
jgi:replication factor A2